MYDYLIFDRKPTTADQTEDSLAEVSSGFSSEWLNAFREEQDALFLATAFVLLRNYAQEDTLQIAFLPGKRKNEDTCHPPLFCETTVKENDDFFSLLSACRTFLRFSTTPTSDGEKRPVIHAISPVDHAWITFFAPGAEKASFGFTYPSSLFSPSTMQNMLSQWKQILHAVSEVAGNTEKACLSLSRIVLEPLSLQVAEKNAQTLTGTIWERFAEQVKKTPDAVGLVDGKRHYTYREMREKAVALSTHLAEQGVVRGDHVAFYAQRCAESIFAILAILRCGAAYVPLNPEAPIFHDREILRDCEARVLLTYGGKASGICPSLDLEDEALFRPLMGREKEQDAYSLPISDEDLAYIIYTSGTTGKPKGVMVTQKNVLHLVSDSRLRPAQGKRRILAQTVQLAFDPSTFDLWTTLLYGGCLHIVTEDVLLNGKQLERYLKQHAITAMCLTTALFNYYALEQTTLFSSLRYLLFGGEKVSDEAVQKVHAAYPSLMMVNGYGPTENTTCTTIQVVGDGDWERTPIGRPVEGSGVVILRNGTVCGVGIPGELCAWGNGVSRGYLKREELNAEKFTSNPFGEGKLYHTGDLCRCLPDGQIDFLGRMDRQIKLRGFRIELEDIESNVKKLAGIQDAAVVVDHSENPHLIAFLVMEEEGDISLLQSELAKRLPSYMLPSHWVRVDNIPLTNNGKVHREALLASFSPQTGEEGYEAPQTETELALCHLFEELLGEKPIGRRAHFIEWGGNSLHVVKLLHRVEETFGVSLGMADVFAHPYPLTLAKYIEEKRAYTKESQANAFPPVMPARYYPLSPTQQGIVMEAQWGAQSIAYNNPTWFYYAHRLEAKRLEQALKTMVKRHEILRTRFVVVDAQLMQEIVDTAPIDFAVLNADELAKTDRKQEGEAEWFSWQSVLVRPFALDTCPLFRVRLIHKGKGSYLFLDLHHAITDGISLGLFLAELSALYGGKALCAPAAQYKSYSEWMSHRDTRSQRQAWQEDLLPLPQPLDLVTDALRPKIRTDRGDITYLSVPETLTHSVHALCQKRGVTAYMVFFSALAVYLAKVGRSEDFLLGSSFSGRVHRQSEDMLGMFVQTLPLRVKPQADKTFFGFLEEMREYLLAVHDRQEIAMQELVRDLRLPTDPAHHPLYDIVFVYQNQQTLAPIFDGEKGKVLASAHTTAKFDLTFYLEDVAQGYRLGVEYNRDLFTPQTAQRMLVQYRAILQQTLAQPEMTIGQIEAVLAPEKEKILGEWNATQADYPKDKTLVDLFIEQVRKTPKRAALRFRGESYTYETLYAQARRVCRQLQQHGVKPGDFVALYVQRCPEMVAGMLGTLLAGASYVPINTMYPKERVQFILEDSEAKALLLGRLPLPVETEVPQITLYPEEEDGQEAREERGVPDGCAYVIYTSGTSGKPKGVMVSHRNVVRLLHNTRMPFSFSEQDVWTMFHSYGFDFSVWEMYGALLYGGCLVIVEEETAKNAQAFYALLKEEKVTVLNQVPSSFYALSPFVRGEDGLCVRYLIFGGEALTPSKVKHWHEAVPGCQIINMYGITETTVHVTYQEITEKEMAETGSPIGRPIPTLQTYIMQKDVLCGVGIPGELCVAGDGVSLGYLHRDELTKKRFVSNPFGEGKMYRSGDLARYLPDGRMEYLGRIDQQVKVRGFRIELGEIEEALREQDGIGDVAVLADTFSGERSLCAYLVSEETLDITAVKEKLRQRLPEYMVPPAMMQIARLPLTANGKLDRRGLPKIEKPKAKAYVAPETESEKLVCRLFEEILAVRGVGCMDNFFELGGHSLRAAELLYRLEEESGKKIAFHELFHASNVRELADVLDKADEESEQKVHAHFAETETTPVYQKNSDREDVFPMAPAQMRMYLTAQRDKRSLSYNVPQTVSFDQHLDAQRLEQAIHRITAMHEILRTDYHWIAGEGMQQVHHAIDADFSVMHCESLTREEMRNKLHTLVQPFNLGQAPLWRIRLLVCKDGDLLWTDFHHILCDGITMQNFYHTLGFLYAGNEKKVPEHQYRDYVFWKRQYNDAKEEEYWLKEFSDELPVLDLITDFPRPKAQCFDGMTKTAFLDQAKTKAIKAFAQQHNLSLYMVFLGALMILLSRYTRQKDLIVGSPFSGRTKRETLPMLGMFVNMLALRGKPDPKKKVIDFMEEVRATTALAAENQEYSFDKLVAQCARHWDPSRHPMFDVVLAVQTQEDVQVCMGNKDGFLLPLEEESAKFDLTFNVEETPEGFRIAVQYATCLFREVTIERLIGHYLSLLSAICQSDEGETIDALSMWMPGEKERVLQEWNATSVPVPHEKTVAQLLVEQCRKTPKATAIVDNERSLTYEELALSVIHVRDNLQRIGVRPGDYVALLPSRRAESILALCGILAAGAAYVPINASFPVDKIKKILDDCHPRLLLTQRQYPELSLPQITFTDIMQDTGESSTRELCSVSKPTEACYVIYTSGTTGEPKGVVVSHHSVVSLARDPFLSPQPPEEDHVLQTGQLAFDASVYEIWSALLNGGTLFLTEESTLLDAERLHAFLEKNGIRRMFLTTALFNQLSAQDPTVFQPLRILLFGGEEASPEAVERMKKALPDLQLFNIYGPTETTTFATTFDTAGWSVGRIPIGRPMANMSAFVMDGTRPCEIGVPGELCIGGDGVALEYLQRKEQTAQRFISLPYSATRVYRSGDVVRWLEDGSLDFLGRMDTQVKIRGFRIELGEVENVLRRMPEIADCAVVVRQDKQAEKALVAFLVPQNMPEKNKEESFLEAVRMKLENALPTYMIPSAIAVIAAIPLNKNGKLDRKALPEVSISGNSAYIAPRTEKERILCQLFEQILHLDVVGIHDNFFAMGGHSLLAARLCHELSQQYGMRLTVSDIFEQKNPEALAACLCSGKENEDSPLPRAPESSRQPMTDAQKRIFLYEQLDARRDTYHIPLRLRIEGKFDEKKAERIFQALVDQHEMLRTGFCMQQREAWQVIHEKVSFTLEHLVVNEDSVQGQLSRFIRPFALDRPPLFRVAWVETKQGNELFLDFHHIAVDGLSSVILMKEFMQRYHGETPAATRQFRDYTFWMQSKDRDEDKAYWEKCFEAPLPTADLPMDHVRSNTHLSEGKTLQIVPHHLTIEEVDVFLRRMQCTPYVFFSAMTGLLLSRYYASEDVVLGVPFTGRTHPETENMIGMFVNTVPMRLDVSGSLSLKEYLHQVQTQFLEAAEHQDYTYNDILDHLEIKRSGNRTPLFDVFFNYMDDSFALPLQGKEFHMTSLPIENTMAKFDLTFDVSRGTSGYILDATFRTALFEDRTIQRMLHHLETLLRWAVDHENSPIGEAEILTEDELKEFKVDFQCTSAVDLTPFPDLLRQQAQKQPNHIALSHGTSSLTYAQLNEHTDHIASALLDGGVKEEEVIGIFTDVGFSPFYGAIGAMKAGAAYLPLDASYPKERLHFMCKQSGVRVILYDSSVGCPDIVGTKCIKIQDAMEAPLRSLPAIRPEQLCYIIFTSGSTGTPKGVMVEHRSLSNLIDWNNRFYHITSEDHCTKYASFAFDASVHEMFPPLAAGASISIIPSSIRLDVIKMWQQIEQEKITVAFYPTPVGEQMVRIMTEGHVDPTTLSLRVMIMGGDRLTLYSPYFAIGNNYGPTEGTVLCSAQLVRNVDDVHSIGRPIPNAYVDIRDAQGRLQPVGVPGEICLRGINVARGYIGDERRTQEAFNTDADTGERTYRTGDRALWLPDGKIRYIGRMDAQLKIRGNRVELGEIEVAAARAGLSKPIVMAYGKTPDVHLALFYLANEEIDPSILREKLRQVLPGYMIPDQFLAREKYPMTPNGKIDHETLQQSILEKRQSRVHETMTPVQKVVFAAWSRALPGASFGLDDPFFEVGGTSLTLVTMVSDLSIAYPDTLQVAEVFAHPTIREIAEAITASQEQQGRAKMTANTLSMVWRRPSTPNQYACSFAQGKKADLNDVLFLLVYNLLRLNGVHQGAFYLRQQEEQFQLYTATVDKMKNFSDFVDAWTGQEEVRLTELFHERNKRQYTLGIQKGIPFFSLSTQEAEQIRQCFDLYVVITEEASHRNLILYTHGDWIDEKLPETLMQQLEKLINRMED